VVQRIVLGDDAGERLPSRIASASRRELKRTIRRPELRRLVPLADTTVYEME